MVYIVCEARMRARERAERVESCVAQSDTDINGHECDGNRYKGVRRQHSNDDRSYILKKDCTQRYHDGQQDNVVNSATSEVGEESEHTNRSSLADLCCLRMDETARILIVMKRIGVVFILILAFSGLADSAYLARQEASGEPLLCNIQNLSGCNIVAASEYSRLFGIPLAQYGVLFYGILFVLAALELVIFDKLLRRVLQAISLVGVIFSLYFTSVQIFFIGAFCIYCLASAIIALLILIFASFIEPMRTGGRRSPPPVAPLPVPHLPLPPSS